MSARRGRQPQTDPHPRPWRREYAETFTNSGTFPLYIVAADGRKLATIWGYEGEREATAKLIVKAVNLYERAQALKAEREKGK